MVGIKFKKSIKQKKMEKVIIFAHKTEPNAVIPKVAYNNTSAAFDLTCTQTTTIPPNQSGVIPNGLNLTIGEGDGYYMKIDLRSSMGFKKEMVPHSGIVDEGYTGNLGVKVYNLGTEPITINEGERYAQITVLPRPNYSIQELNDEEFEEMKLLQSRGDGGFGSSGK